MQAVNLNQWREERRIAGFIEATGADRATAIDYLEAEEWIIEEALISYRGDMRVRRERYLAEYIAKRARVGWEASRSLFIADDNQAEIYRLLDWDRGLWAMGEAFERAMYAERFFAVDSFLAL